MKHKSSFSFKSVIKDNYLAIIFAALLGAVYFLPNIVLAIVSPATLHINWEEAYSYGVKIHEVFDGHLADGDPYLFEYKNTLSTWDYYPLALLIGIILRIVKFTNLEQLFAWSDFLLPPITYLIIYALFLKIVRSKPWSLLASLVFVAFPNIFIFRKLIQPSFYDPVNAIFNNIISLVSNSFNIDFSRFFVPSLTMIFFSGFLLLLYNFLAEERTLRKTIIALGISYGLLFYVYFYYWVFATIVLGFLALFLFLYDRSRLRKIVFAGLIGFAVSLFHWLRYILIFNNPNFSDYVVRVGIEHIFKPDINFLFQIIKVFVLLILIWCLRKKITTALLFFMSALLLTIPIVSNLQIFTGFNPQPDHWGSRVNIYIYILVLMSVLYFLFRIFFKFDNYKRERVFKAAINLCVIFLFFVGIYVQINQAIASSANYGLTADAVESFRWIDKNTKVDDVFLSPSFRANIAIPFFTHANVYSALACVSLAGQEELVNRYLDVYALFRVPQELFITSLGTRKSNELPNSHFNSSVYRDEFESNRTFFCETFAAKKGSEDEEDDAYKLPRDIFKKLENDYKNRKNNIRFIDLPWRADYLFWGPGERLVSQLEPEKDRSLLLVYKNSTIEIFKILRLPP